MHDTLESIEDDALREIQGTSDEQGLDEVSIEYLGRKGVVTQYLRNISRLPAEQRPEAGKKANALKKRLDAELKSAQERIRTVARSRPADFIDVSLPGRPAPLGGIHPITIITREICDIFQKLGFDIAEGPEAESDYYNLNRPESPER